MKELSENRKRVFKPLFLAFSEKRERVDSIRLRIFNALLHGHNSYNFSKLLFFSLIQLDKKHDSI